MFYHIKSIEPNAQNYSIKLIYSDDVAICIDFNELLEKGIMKQLKNPNVFNNVEIGNKGRSIVWKDYDIDFCADSLRLKAT